MKNSFKPIRICVLFYGILAVFLISMKTFAQDTRPAKEHLDSLYQQAVEYYKTGDNDKTIALLTQLIELNDMSIEAYWMRGNLFEAQGKYDVALVDFQKVLELVRKQEDFDQIVTVLYKMSYVSKTSGNHAKALEYKEQAEPENVYGMLGWQSILQGQFDKARSYYENALSHDSWSSEWKIYLGHTYLLTGDVATARTYYEKALQSLEWREELENALEAFDLFIQKGWSVEACRQEATWMEQTFDTMKATIYSAKAQEFQEKKEYTKALAYYQQALKLNRKWKQEAQIAMNLAKIGNVYILLEQYSEALNAFQEALRLNRKLEKAEEVTRNLAAIGDAYSSSGQYEQALVYYEQALGLQRKSGQPTNTLSEQMEYARTIVQSWNLIMQEEFDEAKEYCQNALTRYPKSTELKIYLGHSYLLTGELETAREYYEESVKLLQGKEMPEWVAESFEVFIQKGWHAEHCRQESKLLEQQFWLQKAWHEQYPLMLKSLPARVLSNRSFPLSSVKGVTQEGYEKAIEWHTKNIALISELRAIFSYAEDPHVATAYYLRGLVYLLQGQYELAISDFRKTLELQPHAPHAYDGMGICFLLQSKFDEAKEIYQKADQLELGGEIERTLHLGHAYFLSGDMATAQTYYEKVFHFRKKAEDWRLITNSFEEIFQRNWYKEALHQGWTWNYKLQQALEYYQKGDYEKVLACYHPILEFDPVYLGAYRDHENQQGERSLGIAEFRDIIASQSDAADAHGILGWLLILQGRFDEAREPCHKAHELASHDLLAPYDLLWILNLGHLYLLAGDVDTAVKYYAEASKKMFEIEDLETVTESFERLIQRNWRAEVCRQVLAALTKVFCSEQADEYGDEAGTLFREGNYQEALEAYKMSLAMEQKLQIPRLKEMAITSNRLGSCYFGLGQYTQALDAYERAVAFERERGGDDRKIGVYLDNIGQVYLMTKEYPKALQAFKEALEFARKTESNSRISTALNSLGRAYQALGQHDNAFTTFQQLLDIYHNDSEIAFTLNNLGLVETAREQYAQALNYFKKALAFYRESGGNHEVEMAMTFSNIALIYSAWGQYDKALDYYERSLELYGFQEQDTGIAFVLNNIASIYSAWGRYDIALDYNEQALELQRASGRDDGIAYTLMNIGLTYYAWGRYKEALDYYNQALELYRQLKQDLAIAMALTNIGGLYGMQERYEEAIDSYQQALTIYRRLGQDAGTAMALTNIGKMLHYQGKQLHEARDYYEQALKIVQRLEKGAETALILYEIGAVSYTEGDYLAAIPFMEQSIEMVEQLRKTAPGNIRRDYFTTMILIYQTLTSCYVRTGDLAKAFEIIELSRAKWLAEQLAGSKNVTGLSLEALQHVIPEDTAVLVYANTDQVELDMIRLIITNDEIIASEHAISDFAQNVGDDFNVGQSVPTTPLPGLTIIEEQPSAISAGFPAIPKQEGNVLKIKNKSDELLKLITAYRDVLQNPAELEHSRELGKKLYGFLLGGKDAQTLFAEKTRLLIVPDGALNFLPFETLVNAEGQYLVERYQIRYAQSLGVLEAIRQEELPANRKPLLAFGGAVYDAPAYEAEMIENDKQLAYVWQQVDEAVKRGSSVDGLYRQLRGGTWKNLPGTLYEVEAIQQAVTGVEIITGQAVNEPKIKEMSANGELSNYKVLHFATHGDVDPQIPELSALVLSQSADNVSGDDGYLRAGEIYQLDIQADFVNLSACQTGLGKLYSGEGVVGLTQAFLIAGAKGLSVSLWQVSDDSTSQFMVALYQLVQKQDMGYAAAITEVKRRFINGDFGEKWKVPYYWAPFVYYGDNE